MSATGILITVAIFAVLALALAYVSYRINRAILRDMATLRDDDS